MKIDELRETFEYLQNCSFHIKENLARFLVILVSSSLKRNPISALRLSIRVSPLYRTENCIKTIHFCLVTNYIKLVNK